MYSTNGSVVEAAYSLNVFPKRPAYLFAFIYVGALNVTIEWNMASE